MTRHGRAVLWMPCVAVLALAQAPARAQTAADSHAGRFEVTAGALWLGGATLGSNEAELRSRTPGSGFTLFATETRTESAPGFDARVGYWLLRFLAVEGGFVYSRPSLSTRVTSDAENAAAVTLEEALDQYFVDAGAVLLLTGLRFGEHTVPFVSGGAGYLRQLHEGRTLVETGRVYHVGGGVRHALRMRDTGVIRGFGLRVDARAYVLSRGVRLDEGSRTHGAISGGLFLTF